MSGRDVTGRDWDHVDPPAPDDFPDGEIPDGGCLADEPYSFEDFGPPLHADGIKARSRRGDIGDSWWSRRFLTFLDDLGHGGRLSRGRSYARKGQVVELVVEAGTIRARVQGSRPEPYDVSLAMDVVAVDEWASVEAELAGRAAYAAALLDGRLPHDFEEVARRCGVELLESRSVGLFVHCSCPDAATVCKHVAAVCYLAAEAFDDDPFLLLLWRGRSRDELLSGLRRRRTTATPDVPQRRTRSRPAGKSAESGVGAPAAVEFWRAGPGLDEVRVRPVAARVADAALAERGPMGLNVGPLAVEDLLGPMYLRITQAAEARAYGDE